MIKIPANIPFAPSKTKFFYGWVVLFAGTIGVLASIPGQTMGVSVFTDHLIADLEVSRVQISLAYLIGTALSGFIITYAGILYDKMGARVIAMGAGFLLGIMLIYLTKVDYISGLLVKIFKPEDLSYITIPLLIIGFFGIRFFGQGVLTMTSRNMVMKWFDKKRGFANALLGVFTALGFSVSPKILKGMIDSYQWKEAWIILAVIVGVLFVIFSFLFFRDNPSDAGLIPDGKIIKENKKKFKSTPDKDYTLKEAISTYSFWLFNLNLTLFALFMTALTFHLESIFRHAGYSSEVAISIFIPSSFVAVSFSFIGSWLSDYTRLKYFLILSFGGILLAMTGFIYLKTLWGIPLLIAGSGITQGMFGILMSITWPRFFGLKNLGSISGFVMSFTVLGSALGPFIFSLSEKITDSYIPVVIILFVITFFLFILSFKANNVNDKTISKTA
jgi:OFA family oxalate/formate antiporter-like MFS transporter